MFFSQGIILSILQSHFQMYNNNFFCFLPMYSTIPQNLYFSQPFRQLYAPTIRQQPEKRITQNNLFQKEERIQKNTEQITSKQDKITLKKKRKLNDDDFGAKIQKEDRNSFSNSLKIFLKFVRDLPKRNYSFISTIIQRGNSEKNFCYSINTFYEDLQKNIPKKKAYIGMTEIQFIIKGQASSQEFATAFRKLLRVFYRREIVASVLTSKRIQGQAKRKQIQEGRSIYSKFSQIID